MTTDREHIIKRIVELLIIATLTIVTTQLARLAYGFLVPTPIPNTQIVVDYLRGDWMTTLGVFFGGPVLYGFAALFPGPGSMLTILVARTVYLTFATDLSWFLYRPMFLGELVGVVLCEIALFSITKWIEHSQLSWEYLIVALTMVTARWIGDYMGWRTYWWTMDDHENLLWLEPGEVAQDFMASFFTATLWTTALIFCALAIRRGFVGARP